MTRRRDRRARHDSGGMIEILLDAERNLTIGMLDHAEKLYWQAIENDPQNAIAVVGLARVALERGDERTAYAFAVQALTLDPENAAAVRLETRLAEVMTARGESIDRPEVAIAAATRAEEAGRRELEAAARGTPTPAPPRADFPGDRPLGAGSVSQPPAPVAPTPALSPSAEPVPQPAPEPPADAASTRWRPGLFQRLAGRARGAGPRREVRPPDRADQADTGHEAVDREEGAP